MGYGYGPPPQQQQGYPMQAYGPTGMNVWTCRACGMQGQAMVREKISTAGWIIFAVLLIVCFPLFWIGLLMKERVAICPRCGVNA